MRVGPGLLLSGMVLTMSCGGERLSETVLYADITTRELGPGVRSFTPRFPLWSDGTGKDRYLFLPEGERIDTSDPDFWMFPVGARAFKTFEQDGLLLETRMIHRVSTDDYDLVTYVWDDDERDAQRVDDGVEGVRGTTHDVPSRRNCRECHVDRGRILGFSAVQLAEASPLALAQVEAESMLTDPIPRDGLLLGNDVATRALGYLHANCGSCHQEGGEAYEDTDMIARWSVTTTSSEASALVETNVGVGLDAWRTFLFTERIVRGSPDESALLGRMLLTNDDRMPPIASKVVDEGGAALVRQWIESL